VASHLKELERLDLRFDAHVTDIGFDALASMTNLEVLNANGVDNMETRFFDAVSHLRLLSRLGVSGKSIEIPDVTPLAGMKYLRSLRIERTNGGVGRSKMSGLSSLVGLTGLVLLNARSLTGDHLSNLRNLEELHLNGCAQLDSSGMEGFRNFSSLKVIKFSKCDGVDDGIVNSLKWITHLEQIYISSCSQFTGKQFGALAQLTELTTVVLQFLGGINDGILRQINALTSLRRLELFMCEQITEDGLRVLLSGDLKNLEYLNISGSLQKLTTQSFKNKLPKFKKLYINSVSLFK